MIKNVLVTVDGSELSERALDYAVAITPADGAITLLSVVDLPDITAYGLYPMPIGVDYVNQTMNYAENGTKEYVARLAADLRERGLTVHEQIAIGDAAEMIITHAQEQNIDVVVMSTHGRSGISQWLFGSVTQKVLSRMPCPVFVVPGRKSSDGTPEQMAEGTSNG